MASKLYLYLNKMVSQVENIKVEVGQVIQQARIAKGLTQKELGEKVGVGEPTISKYEKGNQNLTVETLSRVSDALGMKLKITFH